MAGGSSRRAKRRRRHARHGKPAYPAKPQRGQRPGVVIVDEVPDLPGALLNREPIPHKEWPND